MEKCRACPYMNIAWRAKENANNSRGKHPRGACMCKHPKAVDTFNKVCPNSPRMAGFIGFTTMNDDKPQIKTSPKWCPLKKGREQTKIVEAKSGPAPVICEEKTERNRGRWVNEDGIISCPFCGEEHSWILYRANYCETCGAALDPEIGYDEEET